MPPDSEWFEVVQANPTRTCSMHEHHRFDQAERGYKVSFTSTAISFLSFLIEATLNWATTFLRSIMKDATRSADQSQHSKPTRLINVHTLGLESINWTDPATSNSGRYAILSHTWGAEEVSFDEWQGGTATHKTGYAKIVSACRVAKDEGEQYIWVDTCCIDKNNNSELSEAINSMFAWYAGATVCYAVLSDVKSGHATSNSLQQLRESRWFTRGWTLQELLAPSIVKFFDGDWSSLGSRSTLLQVLSEITGIDAAVLDHRTPISRCSVAQRISWASRRKTTKPEDLAYCLLGILDVKMPLLYGEGQHAFRRLQEEILKSSGDLTVLAWSHVEPSRSSCLFALSPADFFGCGRLVTDASVLSSEHWMTSRGLKGTLSVLEYCEPENLQESMILALLGCHEDGMPHEPTTLRLTTFGIPLAQNDNVLSVSPLRDMSSHASLLSRLLSVKRFDVSAVRQLQATILTNGHESQNAILGPKTPLNRSPLSPDDRLKAAECECCEPSEREKVITSDASGEDLELAKLNSRDQALCCGMSKPRCILVAVIALLVVVVVIGAVTGEVVGTRNSLNEEQKPGHQNPTVTGSSGSDASSTSRPSAVPMQAYRGSRASLISSDDGSTFYGYFQDPDGNVVETSFTGSTFISLDQNIVVDSESTFGGSPIAATTWTSVSGTKYRAVFFQNEARMVMVTNTSGTRPWSEPYSILTNDFANSGSIALAVGSGTSQTGLNGVRVYYSSIDGWIQEVGTDFSGFTDKPLSSPWYPWFSFPNSDPDSGVGFTVSDGSMNVYVANKTSSTIQQWQWQYSQMSNDNQWKLGAGGPKTRARSNIVSTYDGMSDHIAYQVGEGGIRSVSRSGDMIGQASNVAGSIVASPLSVTPISSGSAQGVVILYQGQNNQTVISYQIVTDTGDTENGGVWKTTDF